MNPIFWATVDSSYYENQTPIWPEPNANNETWGPIVPRAPTTLPTQDFDTNLVQQSLTYPNYWPVTNFWEKTTVQANNKKSSYNSFELQGPPTINTNGQNGQNSGYGSRTSKEPWASYGLTNSDENAVRNTDYGEPRGPRAYGATYDPSHLPARTTEPYYRRGIPDRSLTTEVQFPGWQTEEAGWKDTRQNGYEQTHTTRTHKVYPSYQGQGATTQWWQQQTRKIEQPWFPRQPPGQDYYLTQWATTYSTEHPSSKSYEPAEETQYDDIYWPKRPPDYVDASTPRSFQGYYPPTTTPFSYVVPRGLDGYGEFTQGPLSQGNQGSYVDAIAQQPFQRYYPSTAKPPSYVAPKAPDEFGRITRSPLLQGNKSSYVAASERQPFQSYYPPTIKQLSHEPAEETQYDDLY
ncbi:MAG: hypothetical protein GY696_10270, partial [Gammaproteobacteria bacterium]|nr:hypothetical protein [Gammaproteobacteria bacterium]